MRPESVEQALAAARDDDTQESRARLFRLLLEAELIVAAVEEPDEELIRTTEEGEELELLYLEPGVMAVYIDINHLLGRSPRAAASSECAGADLFRLAADNPVTRIEVNPASEARRTIERWEIEALARGRLPDGGPEDGRIEP